MSKNYWRVQSEEEKKACREADAKIQREKEAAEKAKLCPIYNVKKGIEHDKIIAVVPYFVESKCTRCHKLLMDFNDFKRHVMNRCCVIQRYHPFPPKIFSDIDTIKNIFSFGKTEELGMNSPIRLIDFTTIQNIVRLVLRST
jgi:hypothetical protein